MIIDKLSNACKYYALSENIKHGLMFLQQTNLQKLECKKHEISGTKVWANVQELMTKDEATTPFEVHKRYTDIQYVICGCEKMQWANLEDFEPSKDFDKDNDIQFGNVKTNSALVQLIVPQGFFVIFSPDDVHKPALKIQNSQKVKKIIVKVEN